MDPQVRIFHEITWEALEDAGYDPQRYPGLIGLYAGAAPNSFWESQLVRQIVGHCNLIATVVLCAVERSVR